jgi:predicted RNA-binding Zn-ribbon protein involved in translation (DUF1610 family)
MKYALICGKKTEATKGAIGFCPSCGSELIAKCGEVKIIQRGKIKHITMN